MKKALFIYSGLWLLLLSFYLGTEVKAQGAIWPHAQWKLIDVIDLSNMQKRFVLCDGQYICVVDMRVHSEPERVTFLISGKFKLPTWQPEVELIVSPLPDDFGPVDEENNKRKIK